MDGRSRSSTNRSVTGAAELSRRRNADDTMNTAALRRPAATDGPLRPFRVTRLRRLKLILRAAAGLSLARRTTLAGPAIVALMMLSGCATIATFDRTAYEKATDAKVAALNVMSRSSKSFASQEAVVTPLLLEVEQAYEYDRGRAKNSDTVKQWEILLDPAAGLYGSFLRRWQAGKTFTPDAISERKTDVADAFDQIIALERGKRLTKNP